MRYISNILKMLINLFTPRFSFLEKKNLRSIDLSDLFTDDFEQIPGFDLRAGDFKSFSSTDDYNREFLTVFQTFRKSFVLDYKQRDGHFRV